MTPKHLIMSLLNVRGMEVINLKLLTKWGDLFDIDPAATRMALGRLSKQGLLQATRRGVYTIGPKASAITEKAKLWSEADKSTKRWSGEWIIVYSQHLGRTNKTTLRANERALRLCGLSEWQSGLWCRPANLVENLDATQHRLLALGMETGAIVTKANQIADGSGPIPSRLWPIEEIEFGYQQNMQLIEESTKRLGNLELDKAVKESFMVGEQVVQSINADPMLPKEMVDTDLRTAQIRAMKKYNKLAARLWLDFSLD